MIGEIVSGRWFGAAAIGLLLAGWGGTGLAAGGGPLLVAASEPDIEAIVRVVGGTQVETFSLFEGCILKKHLAVNPAVKSKLLGAGAVVWTGFMPEAGAIRLAVGGLPECREKKAWNPTWINLSKGAVQVDPASATGGGWCEGDANEFTTHGDPFYRLNPENGSIMAREVAKGLAKLRPDHKTYFEENAKGFSKTLALDIERWRAALEPLAGMRVLCTQCGWQNFARLGGPELLVCKKKPGCCPTPEALVKHVEEMKVAVILLDPHTMPNHAKALRTIPKVILADVPSSIGDLPGTKGYAAIFDNFVEVLQKCAQDLGGKS